MTMNLEQARQHFMDGVVNFEARQLKEALADFEAARALAPQRASVLGNLGITQFHLGLWPEAVLSLQQALAVEADYLEARAFLGLSHEACGHWAEAAMQLEQALPQIDIGPAAWLALGRSLGMLGRLHEALPALDRALAAKSDMAEAWSVRGNVLRDLERLDEAAECFARAIQHGADPELHAYYLAAARGEHLPAPPRHFVENLFDEYSVDFDEHLVEWLDYRGHERLLQPLLENGRRYREVLDLGCGTGLCGEFLAPHADAIDGIDLSSAMLAKARSRGVYRSLAHGDIAEQLTRLQTSYDLVIAADVFIYVGALEAVFAGVRRILQPGACFAFTLERCAPEETKETKEADQGYRLLPTLRYAHSEAYVRRLADEYGFRARALHTAPLRTDQNDTLDALYVYLD